MQSQFLHVRGCLKDGKYPTAVESLDSIERRMMSLEEQLESTSISTEALLVAERDGLREQLESLQFALRLIEVGPTTAETRDALRGVLYPAMRPSE